LAKLQEDKLHDRHHDSRSLPPHQPQFLPLPSPLLTALKQLTFEEMALHRDQGLCYYCDDKWIRGHRCKPQLHLFIANGTDDPLCLDSSLPLELYPDPQPQISLNVVAGTLAPETLCIYGSINNHQVIILVDSGSTHNFIQSHIAKFLHLPSTLTPTLRVMVGNGNTLCQTLISSMECFYHSTLVATQGQGIVQIDCQIQERKPQGNGQNNHFMKFSGP